MRNLVAFRLVARGEAGQSLPEMAIALGFFLVFLIGIFDLGIGVFYSNALSEATREGARKGIVVSTTLNDVCKEAVKQSWLPGVSQSGCDTAGTANPATPSWCKPTTVVAPFVTGNLQVWVVRGSAGGQVKVWTAYAYTPIAANMLGLGSNPVWLCGVSSMYVEK